MKAVYKRELRSYLYGMTGAVVVSFLLLMTGIFVSVWNLRFGSPALEIALSGNLFLSVYFFYILIIPVLTMRSIAEEKHSRTDQLLYSLPLSMGKIVLAKYFSMVTVLAVPCLVMCFYPLILGRFGTVNLAGAYGGIFAFFLLGAALTAIGMFISSLTESQVLAAVITLGAFVLLLLLPLFAQLLPDSRAFSLVCFLLLGILGAVIFWLMTKNGMAAAVVGVIVSALIVLCYAAWPEKFEGAIPAVLTAASLFARMEPFAAGLFDLTAIFFYLSCAALFVWLTIQSMDRKRWM